MLSVMRPSNRATAFVFCFALSLMTGCGGGDTNAPSLGQVSGMVTLDDAPLADVMVMFESDTAAAAKGKTDSEGKYELTYVNNESGAPLGNHVVRNISIQPGDAPDPSFVDPIPKKYNENSELTATVKAGNNQFDFALSSD